MEAIAQRYPDWAADRTAPRSPYLRLPAGISGIHYTVVFAGGERLRLELYIDPRDDELQERAWSHFVECRDGIEQRLGRSLTYEERPGSRASRIASYYPAAAVLERESDWPRYWEWIVDELGSFRAAVQPAVDALAGGR